MPPCRSKMYNAIIHTIDGSATIIGVAHENQACIGHHGFTLHKCFSVSMENEEVLNLSEKYPGWVKVLDNEKQSFTFVCSEPIKGSISVEPNYTGFAQVRYFFNKHKKYIPGIIGTILRLK